MPITIIDSLGVTRYLGNNVPPDEPSTDKWPIFRATITEELIPRDQWKDLVPDEDGPDAPHRLYIHDQDGVGQCNCDATAAAAEDSRLMAGLPGVKLSAPDLYDRINGGADNGSMLEDAIEEMTKRGIGELGGNSPYWRRGQRKSPADERAKYIVVKASLCPTFDHVYSAVLRRKRIITGIMWYDNFTPDKNGWLPSSGRGNAGGHAIKGYKATRRGNQYGIWHDNSWTPQWGLNGSMVIPESLYGRNIGGWWAIDTITDSGGEDVPPLSA